ENASSGACCNSAWLKCVQQQEPFPGSGLRCSVELKMVKGNYSALCVTVQIVPKVRQFKAQNVSLQL
ncbi:MAG: hypothetical protein ABW168_19835, partial [Sedimenticola sp.]